MMLTAYKGCIQNGKIIWPESVSLPQNAEFIITILDDKTKDIDKAKRQSIALENFYKNIDQSGPLDEEFDKIIDQRVNITRELNL